MSVDIRRMRGGRDSQEVKGDALAFTLGTEEQEKPATSRHAGGETGPEPARRRGGRRRPRARLQDVSAGLPRGPRTVPLHTRGRVVGAQSSASEMPSGAVPLPGRCPGCPEGRSRPALTSTALSLGGCSLGRPRPFPPFMTGPQTRPVSWSVAPPSLPVETLWPPPVLRDGPARTSVRRASTAPAWTSAARGQIRHSRDGRFLRAEIQRGRCSQTKLFVIVTKAVSALELLC